MSSRQEFVLQNLQMIICTVKRHPKISKFFAQFVGSSGMVENYADAHPAHKHLQLVVEKLKISHFFPFFFGNFTVSVIDNCRQVVSQPANKGKTVVCDVYKNMSTWLQRQLQNFFSLVFDSKILPAQDLRDWPPNDSNASKRHILKN